MKELKKKLIKSTYLNTVLIDIVSRIAYASVEIASTLNKGNVGQQMTKKNGTLNSHGEEVTSLDIYANHTIINRLQPCKKIKSIISEENFHEINVNERGRYKIAIDPLDGSSNIGMNIPVGTIFGIYDTINQTIRGKDLIAAGYLAYGTSTVLVVSDGFSAHEFTFNHEHQEYLLTESNIAIPRDGKTYSINDALLSKTSAGVQQYIEMIRAESKIRARYVGSMVADFHRNLKSGGIFIYPTTTDHPNGKLRLLYEIMPLAFINEACGGKAYTEQLNPLELNVRNIHEKGSIMIGSKNMVIDAHNTIKKWLSQIRTA